MQKCVCLLVCLASVAVPAAFAGVSVSAPTNGATVQSPVHYTASATSSTCGKGVASMGIYTANSELAYTTQGSSLNTNLNLSPGTYNTVVEEWDNCGGATTTPITITVSSEVGVQVTSPANDSKVSDPVTFAATASSSCAQGVASMGIYTAPGVLAYVANGAALKTTLTLNPGTYNTVVQEWDKCGGAAKTPISINVGSSSTSQTQVHVTSPANNSTNSSPVPFSATATSSCSKGVGSMGIYTAPGKLAYAAQGASLNTSLALSPGSYTAVVEEWDECGGASTTPVTISVSGGSGSTSGSGEKSFSNLQRSSGWGQYAQRAPTFVDCSPSPCDNTSFRMTQGIDSPSLSGDSTEFGLEQGSPYGDALFNNHLIGVQSSQGLPDTNKTLIPTLHNFVYDVYFYGTNLNASQAVEFDINQFTSGLSFTWGHECRVAGGNEWDIWDNQAGHWVATGVPCYPKSNDWNHLVIQVQRTSNDQLLYQSITLNGQQYNLNATYVPTSTSWYGVTVNYQMDGNSAQTPYNVYLDNLTFKYW